MVPSTSAPRTGMANMKCLAWFVHGCLKMQAYSSCKTVLCTCWGCANSCYYSSGEGPAEVRAY